MLRIAHNLRNGECFRTRPSATSYDSQNLFQEQICDYAIEIRFRQLLLKIVFVTHLLRCFLFLKPAQKLYLIFGVQHIIPKLLSSQIQLSRHNVGERIAGVLELAVNCIPCREKFHEEQTGCFFQLAPPLCISMHYTTPMCKRVSFLQRGTLEQLVDCFTGGFNLNAGGLLIIKRKMEK